VAPTDDIPVAQKAHLLAESQPDKPRPSAARHATARLPELGPDVGPRDVPRDVVPRDVGPRDVGPPEEGSASTEEADDATAVADDASGPQDGGSTSAG
jgi:hypothetical protein